MTQFVLDSKLDNDCFILGELDTGLLLLMDNCLLPWFIIVPKTAQQEIIDLTEQQQLTLQQDINQLGLFIKKYFCIKKLNIASIGNIVSQLHIHVVGRDSTDFCWPNVVWGTTERQAYSETRVNEISLALQEQLGDNFRYLNY